MSPPPAETSPTTEPELRSGFVLPLILTLAVQSMASASSQAIPVLATAAAATFGVDKDHVGFFVAISYLVAMLSALAAGTFSARHGAMRVSQVALLACAVGLGFFATGSAWALLPAAVVLGIGYGPATPASAQILARVTPPRLRNLVFSIKQTGVPLGGMIAGAIVAPLVVLVDWQNATLIVAAVCVALAAALQPVRARLDVGRIEAPRPHLWQLLAPLRAVFGYPAMRRLALISICFSAMQVCLSTYLVIFLIERTGSGLIAAGLVLTVTQAAGVVGRIFWGSVADLTGRPMVILSGLGFTMSLGAILLSMAGPGWPQPVLLAVLVLFGGTAIGWNGVYLAEVARLSPPGRAGEFTGGTGFLTFSGPLIGPTIFGAILWLTNSYAAGFCTAGLFTAIAGVFLARDAMAERRTARQPSDS